MERSSKLPKKILRITDLTFSLPDDFDGDIADAIRVMLDYITTKPELTPLGDNDSKSTIESLFDNILSENKNSSKICMRYGIFERDSNGNYILK